ncbi:tetratricopeptide repeat protein [Actinokineospora soli]|uniref:Tetratricopeptide repeat protein n=1 Tax=Actinokineospora soli TaxID=1048753 RepID=A0ABW2TN77_9PSEU
MGELRTGGRDVAAALHLSYRELEPAQQRMFRLLGAHPGPVTAPAAAALADLPVPVAERLLEDLVDAHLLDLTDARAYRMHDLLAEHARGLADPEATTGFTRLLDYYRAGGDARWYATERAALPAIVERALEQRHDEAAWQVADRAAAHLRGPEALGIAEAATRAARRTGNPAALHRALGHLADAHWDRGDLSAALACTRSRFRLTAAAPDRASALSRLGSLHAMSGRYRASITCYRRALTLTEDEDDLTGRVLANLSHSLEVLGDLRTALRSARRSREIAAATGNRVHTVLSTAQEALVLARTGDHRTAERLALDAVHDAEDLDFALAWAHTDGAEVLLITGKPALARAHAERACAVLERAHHPLLFTMAANTYGAACLRTDDPAAALAQHRLARATAERTGYVVQAERAAAGMALAEAALSA